MPVFDNWGELAALRESWRGDGLKVVFTNGCFDLLHPGHVRLFERAREYGDKLIVAANGDASICRLKGEARPILPQADRAATLAALEPVDAVTLFHEDTPHEVLRALRPDVLVKGADWAHWIGGREVVEEYGGEVHAIPVEPGFSTTDLVAAIVESHS